MYVYSNLKQRRVKYYKYIFLLSSDWYGHNLLWIGGKYNSGIWRWEGRLISTISNHSSLWLPGQPNDYHSPPLCVILYVGSPLLLDDPCGNTFRFLCEAVKQ